MEWTKQDIFDVITEYLEQYGSAVGSSKVRELTQEELTDENLRTLTIPSMDPDTEEWRQTSLRNMMAPITNAVSDLTNLKLQTAEARDNANTEARNAELKALEAQRQADAAEGIYDTVNAWYPPFKQAAEGFYNNTMTGTWQAWYNTFYQTAVGWFPPFKTNTENWLSNRMAEWAAFYTNGAVSEWATLKQDALTATSNANTAAGVANTKAELANSKAGLANTKAELADMAARYAGQQGDRAKAFSDHPWEIRADGYIWVWDETVDNGDDTFGAMIRTNKMIIDPTELTDAQINAWIARITTTPYCIRAIEELLASETPVNPLTADELARVVSLGGLQDAFGKFKQMCVDQKANASDVYTKSQVDNKFGRKAVFSQVPGKDYYQIEMDAEFIKVAGKDYYQVSI